MTKLKLIKRDFHGTIITDYEVEIQNLEIESNLEFLKLQDIVNKQIEFELKEILEEKIYSSIEKTPKFNAFDKIENIIKKYNIQIKQLYGINRNNSLKTGLKKRI